MPKDPPSDVLEWSYTGNRLHPTQKPVTGWCHSFGRSAGAATLVCDPFAGSAARPESRHGIAAGVTC